MLFCNLVSQINDYVSVLVVICALFLHIFTCVSVFICVPDIKNIFFVNWLPGIFNSQVISLHDIRMIKEKIKGDVKNRP